MLGLGWTEMMVVAVVALIVVGPKDLPVMMRQLGRSLGTIRRMGNEFRSEFNKMAAVDDIKDIRKSLTDPLRNARDEIQREFNISTSTRVKPTGALKPDAGGESVVAAIKTQAGIDEGPSDAAKASMSAAIAKDQAKLGTVPDDVPVDLTEAAPAAKPAAKAKTPRKPRAKSSAKPGAASASAETKGKAKPKTASKSGASTGAKGKPAAKSTKSADPVVVNATKNTVRQAKPRTARKTAAAKPALQTDIPAAETASETPSAPKPIRRRSAPKAEE